jgi:hypothetical protein
MKSKERFLLCFALIILFVISGTQAITNMTEADVKAAAFKEWGKDARLIMIAQPPDTIGGNWRWTYIVGRQDYYPPNTEVQTPFGPIASPRANQPFEWPTKKGSGSNWQKAWESK